MLRFLRRQVHPWLRMQVYPRRGQGARAPFKEACGSVLNGEENARVHTETAYWHSGAQEWPRSNTKNVYLDPQRETNHICRTNRRPTENNHMCRTNRQTENNHICRTNRRPSLYRRIYSSPIHRCRHPMVHLCGIPFFILLIFVLEDEMNASLMRRQWVVGKIERNEKCDVCVGHDQKNLLKQKKHCVIFVCMYVKHDNKRSSIKIFTFFLSECNPIKRQAFFLCT